MDELPRGTVTFLFTDIEGSTRLWHAYGETMPVAYERHDAMLQGAIREHGGTVYKTIGDALQVAFPTAASGIGAALDAQRALQAEAWPLPEPLKVRMALHTGAVDPDGDGDYRSPVLNRLGRLLGAAHGAQVLISQATMELARDQLPPGTTLVDLGELRLKDLSRPERIWQLAHPNIREDFPPLHTLDARPNNLPPQMTQFIGREDDVDAVQVLLRRPDVRLVTLTGPGGIGKTRLSLQVAAAELDRFEQGVYQVQLDTITDAQLVPAAIAQALRLQDTGDAPMVDKLFGFLHERKMLLVLDNLEQVAGAARIVGDLLLNAPGVKVIATSRIRLQVQGEHEYLVRPLALPDTGSAGSIDAISEYESVRLFIERARAARSSFAITHENAPAIAEICTRLDGLPLAIELAAARTRILPPEAMLVRLSARLPILTGGAHNLPARQQTLRGAIAWSYELLAPADQMLYRRLAVFSGGATIDAIAAVAGDEDANLDLLDILDGLERLVDHSLLRQSEDAGEPRFSMFETIREFGLERLEEHGEAADALRRHADWVCTMVAAFRVDMDFVALADWLAQMDAEQDNLRSALTWTLEHDPALALRIAGHAGRYWQWRSSYREGWDWLVRALAIAPERVAVDDRARALRIASVFQEAMSDIDGAMASLLEAERLFTAAGEMAEAAFARSVIGILTADHEGLEAGFAPLEQAVNMARDARNVVILAVCLNNLGAHALDAGDDDLARTCLDEALALSATSPGVYRSTVLHSAAELCCRTGDLARAEAMYVQSLRESWPGRLTGMVLANLMGLALAAIAGGQWERAVRLAGAEAALRQMDDNAISPDFGGFQSDYERELGKANEALGSGRFKAIWMAGASTPLDDIVAELLTVDHVPAG